MPAKNTDRALHVPPTDEIITIDGNIFAAMGIPNAEEYNRKVDMALRINAIIHEKGWKKKEAAQRTGFTNADISNVTRGLVDRFSEDRLIALLNALGRDVTIIETPAKGEKGERRFISRDEDVALVVGQN